MISSAALPNVALRNPPSVGPEWFASSSVASPISPAAGISAIAAVTNGHSDVSPRQLSTQLIGAKTSRTFSQRAVKTRWSCRATDTPGCYRGLPYGTALAGTAEHASHECGGD